jgi:decaprenylphospho-beta-D-erythro-pentofuranosid-2-ulose 2-reductase
MRDALGRVQTAAVFGGNSEIARATIAALAAEGLGRVVLAVRDPERVPGLDDLRATGLDVHVVAFDADAAPDAHAAAVEEAFAALGDIDVALVAFGVLGDQERAKRDAAAAVALARTNFVGAVSVLTILGERLKAQGHGAIVVLSSVAGERARRANYPYGATKAGIDAFAQGLGDELAAHGVDVLVVRPGFVHTKMTAGRPAVPMSTDADTVAKEIVAGLRRRAHTVWAPRQLRWIFAAMRHLPRPLFRRVRG